MQLDRELVLQRYYCKKKCKETDRSARWKISWFCGTVNQRPGFDRGLTLNVWALTRSALTVERLVLSVKHWALSVEESEYRAVAPYSMQSTNLEIFDRPASSILIGNFNHCPGIADRQNAIDARLEIFNKRLPPFVFSWQIHRIKQFNSFSCQEAICKRLILLWIDAFSPSQYFQSQLIQSFFSSLLRSFVIFPRFEIGRLNRCKEQFIRDVQLKVWNPWFFVPSYWVGQIFSHSNSVKSVGQK